MLAELGEGGVYLDRCRSGPHGEAGLSLKGRTPSVGLRPGSLAPPQRKVCRPQPNGKNYLGTLVGTGCPLLPPCQGPLPLLSWGICLAHLPSLTLPRHPPPRSLSCWRKLSQGLGEKHQPHGESAQGKTSPCPPSTPSFSGSSQAANHRRGRTVSPRPRLGKGLPAPRSHSRAGLNGANALSWPTANPSLSF